MSCQDKSAQNPKKRGIYELKGKTELNLRMDTIIKRLDAFNIGWPINVANTFAVDSCSICASPMHQAHNCPSMTVFFEMEQMNAFNHFRKQSNGPYSETYNPGWRNHLNFSWKQNQPTNQGGASYQGQNQYPLGFPPSYPTLGCLAQPASTSTHQAPTSSPQSSLEDTL